MITRQELPTLADQSTVEAAIATTAPSSTNSDVATELGLKRWIVVALRQLYNLRRI